MTEILVSFASALWLGILTSISPCPLASNVAAISFLSKKIMHPALVLISGLAYTLGRMVSYAILGWIIISSLLSIPQVAQFLQKYMGKALGHWFNRITRLEHYTRKITGAIFILIGIYYSGIYILKIF